MTVPLPAAILAAFLAALVVAVIAESWHRDQERRLVIAWRTRERDAAAVESV